MEPADFLVIIIWRYTREQLVASRNCRLACGNEEKKEHAGNVKAEQGWEEWREKKKKRKGEKRRVCGRDIFRQDQGEIEIETSGTTRWRRDMGMRRGWGREERTKGFEVRLHEIRGSHASELPQRPQYALVITRDELHRGMSEACYV